MGDNWKSHAKKISEYNYTVHLIDLRNHGRSFGIINSHLKLWSMIFKTMLFSIKSKNSFTWPLNGRKCNYAFCSRAS